MPVWQAASSHPADAAARYSSTTFPTSASSCTPPAAWKPYPCATCSPTASTEPNSACRRGCTLLPDTWKRYAPGPRPPPCATTTPSPTGRYAWSSATPSFPQPSQSNSPPPWPPLQRPTPHRTAPPTTPTLWPHWSSTVPIWNPMRRWSSSTSPSPTGTTEPPTPAHHAGPQDMNRAPTCVEEVADSTTSSTRHEPGPYLYGGSGGIRPIPRTGPYIRVC